jgi:hypothetical protein
VLKLLAGSSVVTEEGESVKIVIPVNYASQMVLFGVIALNFNDLTNGESGGHIRPKSIIANVGTHSSVLSARPVCTPHLYPGERPETAMFPLFGKQTL